MNQRNQNNKVPSLENIMIDLNALSYNDIVSLATEHGFEGNPRGTKKLDLIEFINNNPVKEAVEEHEEIKEETKAAEEDPVQKVEEIKAAEVVEETPKDVVKKKKNAAVVERQKTIAQLVETKLQELTKPIEHTKLFFAIYGDEVVQTKETDTQWRDIGHALQNLVNSGKVIARIPEGKKRMTFTWKHEEVAAAEPTPESTNTDGEGI